MDYPVAERFLSSVGNVLTLRKKQGKNIVRFCQEALKECAQEYLFILYFLIMRLLVKEFC